jgi:Apea-like HEPN
MAKLLRRVLSHFGKIFKYFMHEHIETNSEKRTERLKPFLHDLLEKIVEIQSKKVSFQLSNPFYLQMILATEKAIRNAKEVLEDAKNKALEELKTAKENTTIIVEQAEISVEKSVDCQQTISNLEIILKTFQRSAKSDFKKIEKERAVIENAIKALNKLERTKKNILYVEETETPKKKLLLENNIDCEEIVIELEKILSEDSHLKRCCVNIDRLAIWLDSFISEVFRLTSGVLPNDEKFSEFFAEFSDFTYKEPFKAVVYSHIFNFTTESDTLEFGDLKIQRLDMASRSRVLNDDSIFYLLHPHNNIGEHFIVSNTTDLIENDWDWQIQERIKAEDFARLFQYFKDGVIHINYSTVYFYPEWINPIRNGGIFFYGEQRRFPHGDGSKLYTFNNVEYEIMVDWLNLYQSPDVVGKFDLETEKKNKLGKKIELAGTYFESSHTQKEDVRKLIDLAIALELIFHPHNKDEISFQLSQLAAQFLGENPEERTEIFDEIKLMYTKRSNIFHGNQEQQEKKPVNSEEIERWSSLIRKSLLKMIVLYMRGEESHDTIIKQIRQSLFDPCLRLKMEKETNINLLIQEVKAKLEKAV